MHSPSRARDVCRDSLGAVPTQRGLVGAAQVGWRCSRWYPLDGCAGAQWASPSAGPWPSLGRRLQWTLRHCRQVFEILLSRGYSENSFREDLKNLYLQLGIENKTMIFLFTDAHVAEEGFLELINNMLTSGTAEALGSPSEPCHLFQALSPHGGGR